MKEKLINVLSIVILSLGFFSIILSMEGLFLYSAYFIMAAAILDFFISTSKRIVKVDDVFGKDLDNISDMISFALAPGIFAFLIFFNELTYPYNYVFLVFPFSLLVSGAIRTARINSGRITTMNGMKTTFNFLIPLFFVFDVFNVFLVSGWFIVSQFLMLNKFRIGLPLKKKKKSSDINLKEIKSQYTVDDVDKEDYATLKSSKKKEEKKDDDAPLVPLNMFGD